MDSASKLGEQVHAFRADFVKTQEAALVTATAEDVEKVAKMADELSALEARYNTEQRNQMKAAEAKAAMDADAEALEKAISNGAPLPTPSYKGANLDAETAIMRLPTKNLSALVATSPEYRAMRKSGSTTGEVMIPNALFCIKAAGDPITTASFGFRYDDTGVPTHLALQPQVMDLFRVVPVTGASSVRYMRAVTMTINAAFVTEGALKPETQLRWTPIDAPLEVIAHWTAVTLQALDDIPQLRAIIDTDLRNGLLDKIDDKLLNGTGTPPEIQGILTTAGLPTQAFGTDALTTIAAAITKIVSTGAGYPTGIVMNPADWQAIRLTNSNGIYFFGPPTEQGIMRLWGIPVVVSTHMPAGFALVGNFNYAILYERWGVRFVVGWKNDDLIKNLLTIVCEARLAVGINRLAAFVNADIVTP